MTKHDAYREQRKSSVYWIRMSTQELDILDLLEDVLPAFVGRRYRFVSISRHEPSEGGAWGRVEIVPVEQVEEGDVKAADALHADVGKLFSFLLTKRTNPDLVEPNPPVRTLDYMGHIRYDFIVNGVPRFEAGLGVLVSGLPAGSACHITKTIKGKREIEEFEYTMECDDEAPGGEELEAKAVEETEPSEAVS